MNQYSYSKISSYKRCSLLYDLSYVRKVRVPKEENYDTTKGKVFHKYAEVYRGDFRLALQQAFTPSPPDVTKEFLDSIEQEKKQEIVEACKTFNIFYDSFLKDKTIASELQLQYTDVENNLRITGYVDTLISLSDGSFIVLDYKTPKSINLSLYKDQIKLYIYLLHKTKDIPLSKFSGRLFFPFATVKSEDERFQSVSVTETKVLQTYKDFVASIKEIESPDRKVEPELGFMCKYCDYQGYNDLCPVSVIAGARPIKYFDLSKKPTTAP